MSKAAQNRDEIDLLLNIRWLCYRIAKRMLDVVFSLVFLLFTAPVMFAIWIYIRRHSPEPAIFQQIRIKRNRRTGKDRRSGIETNSIVTNCRRREERRKVDHFGEPFTFYKFTTMCADARERFPELYAFDYTDEEIKELGIKPKNDPRVPPWGRWLRRSSMDELPNFFNVLRGDLSLVGPRPEMPEMVKYFSEEQRRIKLSVKPGVTGYAQIRGRGNLSFQETLACDLEYVGNASFLLDLKILILTFLVLLKGKTGGAF